MYESLNNAKYKSMVRNELTGSCFFFKTKLKISCGNKVITYVVIFVYYVFFKV